MAGYLSCKRDQMKMRDYMDRRVTSPTWGPPPPCKQALNFEKTLRMRLKRLSKKSLVGFQLATSSLVVGRFAAKKGSLHSPRGRLVEKSRV